MNYLKVLMMLVLTSFVGLSASADWYIPDLANGGSGPAIDTTAAPTGYILAVDQVCAQSTVDADPFCVDNFWDGLCQEAYEACIGGFGCMDPNACNYDPLATTDDGSCFYPNVYLPIKGAVGPAILDTCGGFEIPSGYTLASDQACALEVVFNDPFCLDTSWDNVCQDDYDFCRFGCIDPIVYVSDSAGFPAILACPGDTVDLTGYTALENQGCALDVVSNDPFCLETEWDAICQAEYDACVCAPFETAPVDLTKSFDAVVVGGTLVKDRVQVKWYKASPEVRYTDKDAAMCDIEFWAKRNLDPETGVPIGPVIVNPDTVLIQNAKKTFGDGSPREIFKWPVKFRKNSDAASAKRADPNIRYEWRVRCECGHSGLGLESPWSAVKIFNTPDFDPVTGIFGGVPAPNGSATKGLSQLVEVALYPNPNDGSAINLQFSANSDMPYTVQILDMAGRLIHSEQVNVDKSRTISIEFSENHLQNGMYMLNLLEGDVQSNYRFVVK